MAHLTPPFTPIHTSGDSPKRRGGSFLVSISAFFGRLKKQASGAAKKHGTSSGGSPKSPLAKPKQLFVNLSNKAIHIPFRHKNNNNNKKTEDEELDSGEMDFGDGGLWQRNILMGDKCQPLDFSGVIYYDSNGRQLSELPVKSPRASPLPSYLYASSEKF
ncbi:hypothetical protein M9H77_28943 [Catharanthus roseus]|uniref:Uncharacterized protein n=1 Tax=Catharanthus roseus TaxID=4058 RepID=A0ACC0AID9_CATRO|nr:hypothetical protein M9H77_28943 [Catharanthus roseus]